MRVNIRQGYAYIDGLARTVFVASAKKHGKASPRRRRDVKVKRLHRRWNTFADVDENIMRKPVIQDSTIATAHIMDYGVIKYI